MFGLNISVEYRNESETENVKAEADGTKEGGEE